MDQQNKDTEENAGTPNVLDDSVPRDEEGLRTHYDVVICGTGLVQSILASALARVGWSVLHCDAADYYGALDAVWSLPYIQQEFGARLAVSNEETNESGKREEHASQDQETNIVPKDHSLLNLASKGETHSLKIHSMTRKTDFPLTLGTTLSTPLGPGKVTQVPAQDSCLVYELTRWTLADSSHPVVHVGIPEAVLSTNSTQELLDYLRRERSISTQDEKQTRMILEQRSRSLALDVSPLLCYAAGRAVEALIRSGVADYLEWKAIEGLFFCSNGSMERVPCNKNDVFASKLLGPMEKRRLMKFLQLAMDYGVLLSAHEEEEDDQAVESLNERHLNQGRSLARPQNKSVATDDMSVLQASMDMPFEEYLQEKHRLSPKLINLVRYALSLETGKGDAQQRTVREGMKGLTEHMASLGRFGTTAFLVPMYGSGELSQAFCRSAAVYGATYLLRRAPVGIVVDDAANQAKAVLLEASESDEEGKSSSSSQRTKRIACTHVVAPRGQMICREQPSSTTERRTLRRISVLRGKPLGANIQNRHVLIYPPGSIGNKEVIYGLVFDETLNVAPHVPGAGCSILHLTTMIEDRDEKDIDSPFQTALNELLAGTEAEEVFQVTFSSSADCSKDENGSSIDGIHLTRRFPQELSSESYFEEAAHIFEKLVGPNVPFLTMSEAMTSAVEERVGTRDEDDERMVLESAVELIASSGQREEAETG